MEGEGFLEGHLASVAVSTRHPQRVRRTSSPFNDGRSSSAMSTCGPMPRAPRGVTAGGPRLGSQQPRAPYQRLGPRTGPRSEHLCATATVPRFASRTTASRRSVVGNGPVIWTTAGDQKALGKCTVRAIGSAASDSWSAGHRAFGRRRRSSR